MPPNPSSIEKRGVNTTTVKAELLALRQRIIDEDIKRDHPERVAIDSEIARLETILDDAATKNNMGKPVANDERYAVPGAKIYKWENPTGDGDHEKRGQMGHI